MSLMIAIRQCYILLALHCLADYVMQPDFIAAHKHHNWWYMVVHCLVYTIPFGLWMGWDVRILILFATHMIFDVMKTRSHLISKTADQVFHILVLLGLYILAPTIMNFLR